MKERFIQVRGLRIRYVELGDTAAPTLLLVHGLGGSIESWIEILDRLAERLHVIAFDLPGYGRSDRPDAPYTIEYFADFVCTLIDYMKLKSAILAGHSMGGMIVMKAYSKCSEKIKALILIDAAGISRTAAEKIKQYMRDRWTLERLRKLYLDCILGRLGKLDEARLREVLRMMGDPSFRKVYFRALDSISEPLSEEEVRGIRVPTLIIWGSDDKLTPPQDGIKLNQLISGSRLVIVEGAGHSPHREAPRKVVQEIIDFASKI